MNLPKIFKKKSIDKDFFIDRCNNGKSMAKVAEEFDLPFMTFKRVAIELGCYNINPYGKGLLKSKIPLDDILTNKVKFSTGQLKKRLVYDNILEYKCCKCGNEGEWLGQLISLELDHINGDNDDNRLENLRIMCPNCHSQTPTFRNRSRV